MTRYRYGDMMNLVGVCIKKQNKQKITYVYYEKNTKVTYLIE